MNFPLPGADGSAASTADLIPHAGSLALSQARPDHARIFGFDEADENMRPFALLRTQIARIIDESGHRLIGVTSATPAAGKTYISLNLAAALASLNNRPVVLCDLDLRRGSVREVLESEPPVDISALLRGETSDWTDALYRIDNSGLYVVPCRPRARGSSELLSAPPFGQLIAGLRALPEEVIVLVDLPPVFASDDALLTASRLDGYLLVVEYGRNTAEQITETIRLLDPVPCLGTVLNRYKGGLFDAYGYGYGDPYGLKHYGLDE
ncbi:CpsD/CapB family tyrosine-protein kinase [Tsuneonella sp. HG249]